MCSPRRGQGHLKGCVGKGRQDRDARRWLSHGGRAWCRWYVILWNSVRASRWNPAATPSSGDKVAVEIGKARMVARFTETVRDSVRDSCEGHSSCVVRSRVLCTPHYGACRPTAVQAAQRARSGPRPV